MRGNNNILLHRICRGRKDMESPVLDVDDDNPDPHSLGQTVRYDYRPLVSLSDKQRCVESLDMLFQKARKPMIDLSSFQLIVSGLQNTLAVRSCSKGGFDIKA